MLTSNRSYKWITFNCNDIALYDTLGYVFLLEEENHDTILRTDIFDRATFHGGYSSETLASGRLFEFSGRILAKDATARETAMRLLVGQIQPEWNPNIQGRWFYNLERDDDLLIRRSVQAKVYEAPQIDKDLKKQKIKFTFKLLAENETIFSKITKTVTWWIGIAWGFTLPTPIPEYLSWYAWFITLNNEWNRQTPIKVRVQGTVINPKIINLTNQYNYKIANNTLDLIVDNTNPSNSPSQRLIVTDSLVNITQYRTQWGWIYLSPWINHLIVLSDVYPSDAVVTITFRDWRLR